MENTYKPGDRVLVMKNLFSIRQNDILVFRHEDDDLIKRCIGLPGDTLRIINGVVYSNNIALKNPTKAIIGYGDNDEVITRSNIHFTYGNNWTLNDFGPYTIPKKGMRVELTPNVVIIYGQIIKKDKLANDTIKALKKFYIFQNDYLFLVGDNRMKSTDSRVFGPIPVSNIIGKVVLKF